MICNELVCIEPLLHTYIKSGCLVCYILWCGQLQKMFLILTDEYYCYPTRETDNKYITNPRHIDGI